MDKFEKRAYSKAIREESLAQYGINIEKWGRQGLDTLLLVFAEEFGELIKAYLQWDCEGGDFIQLENELIDCLAVIYAIQFEMCSLGQVK